jgi:hypothetical protein
MTKPSTYLDLYEVVGMPRPPHLKEARYAPHYLADFPKGPAYSVPVMTSLYWHLVEAKP